MINLKSVITTVLAGLILQGCTAYQYKEYEKGATATRDQIDETAAEFSYKQVRELTHPPISIRRYEIADPILWLDDPKSITADKMPLSLVLDQITERKVKHEYDFDIDPNYLVSITHNGTKESALKMLGLQADISIAMDHDTIYVRRFESKTFALNAAAGNASFQVGSTVGGGSSTNDEAMGGSISSTGDGDGQYANLGATDKNITAQVMEGIEAILLEPGTESDLIGSVSTLDSMSALVVRTTPSLMKEVEVFIGKTMQELGKEVILEIEVIEWQLNEGSEFGLDANISAAIGSGSINFTSNSPSLGDSTGDGLGFTGSGSLEGTTALLKMLRLHGQVAVTTTQTVKALNQKAQEVDLSDIRSYVARTSTSFEADDAEPTVSIETDTVRDGVKMLVIPSVHEDHVYLRLNGILSKFIYFEQQRVSGVTVSQPRTRQSRFNVEGKYAYNQPYIVTHMKQVVEQTNKSNTMEIIAGNMGERRVLNTLVVLTPRRAMEMSL
ncbi:hypothetical protein [Vibrio agarivorans]|uniref:Type II and III secretion system protein n=1 Tax=Vibrio agarivorans TaxID=153622 RepID=A0ABT7Y7E4_9VIBR|nr:hypothetical protein [Vibrio agarivorans]MDN2483966.1 hypothetical protein [Vibrio agarivorans]